MLKLEFDSINNIIDRFKEKPVYYIIDSYFKDKLQIDTYNKTYVSATEENKTFRMVENICNELLYKNITRDYTLIIIGGGLLTDLGGFIGSIYLRGVKEIIYIPTTILCAVDACTGGKNGINLKNTKNQIGTFREPDKVLIDINLLKSLPKVEIISGFAEIFKYTYLMKSELNELLEKFSVKDIFKNDELIKKIIKISLECKMYFVNEDLTEKGIRKALNFGHTLGHCYEVEYSIPHGIAVYLGMLDALLISFKYNLISEEILHKESNKIYKTIGKTWKNLYNKNINLQKLYNDKKSKHNNCIDFILTEYDDIDKSFKYQIKSIEINKIVEIKNGNIRET